eukprot:TRINITY_DN4092_c1_g3_i1.p1 TRINITY_DN4092_c1_g3~~TRINITY_DN4092_c1_g3_i1.p1  ORF type:complete len:631 (-),score=101.52 TRINITY_DN4092_c1_g3_i1:33-1925(-)
MRILLRPQPQQHPEERLCVADEEDDEDEEELDDDDDEVGFESNQEEDGEEEEVGDELLFWDENVPEQAPAAAGAHRSITPSRSPQLSSPPLSEYFFEAWLQSLQMRFELPSEALKELASEGLSKQVDFTHRFASEDEVGLFCDARGLSALTKTRLRQAWVNCRKDAEQDSSDSEVGSSLKRRRLNSRWSGRTTTAGSHTSSQNSYDQPIMMPTCKTKAKKPAQDLFTVPHESVGEEPWPSNDQPIPEDVAHAQATDEASHESMPVPYPWKKIWSESHSVHYYWHPESNASTWQHPAEHHRHCQNVVPEADSCLDTHDFPVLQPERMPDPSVGQSSIKRLLRLGNTASPAQQEQVHQQPVFSSPPARPQPLPRLPCAPKAPPPTHLLARAGRLSVPQSQSLMPPPPPPPPPRPPHPPTPRPPPRHPLLPRQPVAPPPGRLLKSSGRQNNSQASGADITSDADDGPTKVVDGMWEAPYKQAIVDIDSLRYTQKGCSEVFQCGRTLEQAACELAENGTKGPAPDWCELRVIRRNGVLWSCDNRRLWALKEAQRRIQESDPSQKLQVRIKLFCWHPTFDIFMSHVDHRMSRQDGKCIKVRGQVGRSRRRSTRIKERPTPPWRKAVKPEMPEIKS